MDWLGKKIDNVLAWLVTLIQDSFSAITDFIKDTVINLFDLILGAFSSVVSAISPPSFLVNGLDSMFSLFPDWFNFFFSVTGFGAGLSVIGLGVLFRLTRKLLTLGQW